ncbi:hypothetical protein PC116_g24727 [Phytophthora cactorum]|uniref:Uncharacterized protein n=1 Tax=Phytophthora cactorum TaxID=29920 RepID=A0A8T0YG77_9STRA|nr:hypothetical protein PC112_g20621 [Phytophthora cactorum]KAG2833685.1 hypothetical protein PC113_g20533 [Phytophthora cactorum]KAG2878985.1 hypothetical protein PC114_g22807 [Phytophthora cactorum]KAG2991741.1 hypothetical protein PC120_g22634 [Phytophthora cactorum]KAG3132101.1 hypothetical protein C6341_g23067 [Phytophthora cactorum]
MFQKAVLDAVDKFASVSDLELNIGMTVTPQLTKHNQETENEADSEATIESTS